MQKKPRSLGTLVYPTAELESYSYTDQEAVIKLSGSGKVVRIKLGLYCTQTLSKLTREILQ